MGADCLQGYYFDAPTTRPNFAFGQIEATGRNTSAA
jgi:EAL domain-containing protein (putative c-di-GMP-specific phosphodiesterase class I)